MIRIPCPHCGLRNSTEFRYVGEGASRPVPSTTTPEQWRAYLYDQRNVLGWTRESWYHTFGCRRFFTIERHTLTNEVRPVWGPEQTGRWVDATVEEATDVDATGPT